ncbi:OstA-like protein [Arachidicoccus rhizosphaerae]|uniref:OstA-like protein n=1 Tax=Arachidicoccus rhizosphaerae TaxID=551991 RepID=A0A1H3YFX6_9BACT|nr:OstA-like protein [Arachidicoccus rhizosphaerae]SEA10500.1 OstA-like protein [Arachidicoccus rhizosphaerae]
MLGCLLSLYMGSSLQAQVAPKTSPDSAAQGRIQIIHADRTGFKKFSDSTMIRFASGNVAVRQSSTLFYCDSVAANPETQITEAYGHVHINDNDSIHIYADFMRYKGADRTAFLKNNVRLTDGTGTLTTSALDYDLNTKIAVYSQQGKLVNAKTVLTSQSGTYYGDTKDAQFTKDVKLVDPDYTMTTDTLLYNTVTRVATFTVPTLIQQGPFKQVQTTDGYYDLLHKTAYLGKRPTIIDSSSVLVADEVAADDSSGFAEARGTVVFKDTAQGMVVLCNDLKSSRENASFLATVNPIAIIKQQTDSIFIAADTLYSARYSKDDSLSVQGADSSVHSKKKSGQTGDTSVISADRYITNQAPAESTDSTKQVPYDAATVSAADTARNAADTATLPKAQQGFHKVGKVFVWDSDTSKPDSATQAQAQTREQQEEPSEHKGLFDFFKSKKEARDPSDIKTDTTHPGVKNPVTGQHKASKKEEKKSILGIFNKKKQDVNKGKSQPGIIDSIKAAKPESVADSTAKGKPGLDFSVSKSQSGKDSLPPEDKKNRFLEAYFNVRIYSDSLQGIGDSLYYSGRDSLIQLFKQPTIWTTSNHQISQVSGDTILVQTANNKPQYIRVADNAIMLSQADTLHQKNTSQFFNQMAGKKLEAWFTDGQIDSLSAQGNAHGIFYSLDDKNKYIGVTQQDSRVLNFYFVNKELERIVGKSDVVGRVYPMGEVDHEKIRLKGFQWLEDKRPKSKYDLLAH